MIKLYRLILIIPLLLASCGNRLVYAQTRIAQDVPLSKQRPPAPLSVALKREIEKRTAETLKLTARKRTSTPNDTATDIVPLSAEVEFIIGAQLKSGSALNPAPMFDTVAITKGHQWGLAFPAQPSIEKENYYDAALVQYINYYRTGDPAFLTYARKIADSWYAQPFASPAGTDVTKLNPRQASLSGVMLRALDGKPEYWAWLTQYTRQQLFNWVGSRIAYPELYFGVREGGYMLLYATQLARVHPDPAERAKFRDGFTDQFGNKHPGVVEIAVKYYARLQYPDGSWRWQDDHNGNGINTIADDGYGSQPFMVGLLLEAMGATHAIAVESGKTADAAIIKGSILKSVDNLHAGYRQLEQVQDWHTWDSTPGAKMFWRGYFYTHYCVGCGAGQGTNKINGDANNVRDVRQLNVLIVHAYGLAYKLSGDPKYKQWGDEVFDSSYSRKDGLASLSDYQEKQYNQAYRSSAKYLAWRLGTPQPTPVPLDADLDGIIDALDKCADTKAGVKVDAVGCEIVVTPPPVDSDADGVVDSVDKCPATPVGTKVDATGCPLPVPTPTPTPTPTPASLALAVDVSPQSNNLKLGDSRVLKLEVKANGVLMSDLSKCLVSWISANPAIAIVDAAGRVTAKAAGKDETYVYAFVGCGERSASKAVRVRSK